MIGDQTDVRVRRGPRHTAARRGAGVGAWRARTPVAAPLAVVLVAADAASMLVAVVVIGRPIAGDLAVGIAAVPIVAVLNGGAHLYRRRLSLSALDDAGALAGRGVVALLVALVAAALFSAPTTAAGPAAAVGAIAAGYTAMALIARVVCYDVVRRARAARPRPVVILGHGRLADLLTSRLAARTEYGLRPIGHIDTSRFPAADDRTTSLAPGTDDRLIPHPYAPSLGDVGDLGDVIVARGVRDVIIAFGTFRDHEVISAVETCRRLGCDVYCVPRFFEMQGVRDRRWAESLWGVPVVRLPRHPRRLPLWRVKRAVDVLGAAAGLLVAAPVLAVCALAVRAEGGPGVLFRQDRVGVDGRRFTLLKLRTMRPADGAEAATRWTVAGDARIGPVGRVLRRTSLDELPQLWNVLRGDMSLVGPRPERPHFVAEFSRAFPAYGSRARVPAGLTGLAQVNGLRGDTSIEDRVRFDNLYIENWSLWQDVKIILRTVLEPLRRTGS